MAQAEIERACRHFRVNSLNVCGNNDDLRLSPILNALSMTVDTLLNYHLGDFLPTKSDPSRIAQPPRMYLVCPT